MRYDQYGIRVGEFPRVQAPTEAADVTFSRDIMPKRPLPFRPLVQVKLFAGTVSFVRICPALNE
jgi:hypothetical protein